MVYTTNNHTGTPTLVYSCEMKYYNQYINISYEYFQILVRTFVQNKYKNIYSCTLTREYRGIR